MLLTLALAVAPIKKAQSAVPHRATATGDPPHNRLLLLDPTTSANIATTEILEIGMWEEYCAASFSEIRIRSAIGRRAIQRTNLIK